MLSPQGLCIGCFLCLESSSPETLMTDSFLAIECVLLPSEADLSPDLNHNLPTPKLSTFKQPRLLLLTSVSWLGPDRVGSSSTGLPGGLAEDPGQVAAGAGVAGPLPVQVARPAGDPGFCL